MRFKKLAQALCCALVVAAPAYAALPDHTEFDATLVAPFVGAHGDAREFGLQFSFPESNDPSVVAWRLEIVSPEGKTIDTFYGEERLFRQNIEARVPWAAGGKHGALKDGLYTARMTAAAVNPATFSGRLADPARRFAAALAIAGDEAIVQEYQVQVGHPPKPAMPAFNALPTVGHAPHEKSAAATASLPYTVYYGNLHSQTNHSDGGGVIASCTGAQNPQSGAYGPTDAYNYALGKGLDILMTSEHNHMFDGSDSTNTSANPTTAHNLYQSGLSAASSFNAAHPNFLAVYGMEWGVISNGGHMNILNSTELFGWEYNASNQLIADVFTAKSDYAALYTTMKGKGLVGQFNHPSSSGQFLVGGTAIGYTADGDSVMALAEISNTSAFSTNTTETETSKSSYEAAFKIMLERGYHVAPSTDQDNHCAQWGASYTNRTAVLIPNGTPLSMTSFLDAVKARRVFATHDKNAQLILTANGHLMGERFANSGSLTLTANYASANGHTASSVAIWEGVPGRNGTATQLSSTAVTTITPATGDHYYYAKITQDNGDLLYSAPVWVTQGSGGGDTTPPTVSASETGTSGTITLSATASDANGVTQVEFYVDGALKGTDSSSPYSMTLDSTTLANGSHTLLAKAYDPSSNAGQSSIGFSITNPTGGDTTPPTCSASETGTAGTITLSATANDANGVSKVEFYVDNVLKGTDTTSPYSMTLDSTTLANGSHSLVAKAYDPSSNVGPSTAVSFSISNPTGGNTFNEVESNGSVAAANVVAHSYSGIQGTMGNTTDKDYFALSLAAGEKVKIDMTGPVGTSYDYDLYLVDGSDVALASSEGSTTTESVTWTNGSTAKTVYAKVISYAGSSTTTPYVLTLTYTASTAGPFFQNTTSMAINDNATITSNIAVSGVSGAAPSTLKVGVSIHHTYQGDLKVDLIAPNGTSFNLWNRTGAGTDNIIQTFTVNASSVTAPNGTWKLQVNDNAAGDTGTLDNWSLQF